MKKLLPCIFVFLLLKTASGQLNDLAWFQNQYHNTVQDFAFHGTHVWIAKPDYVMVLDTLSGESQVFNDFIFPENADFGNSTRFNSVLVDVNGNVYVNYYGIENGIYKYDGLTWTNYPSSGFPDQNYFGSRMMRNSVNHIFMAQGKAVGEFDGTNWQTYLTTQFFSDGVIDSNDTLWLTTYGGGKLISFFNGVFTTRLSSGTDYSIAIDDYDNLFFPISGNNILKFHSVIVDTITIPIFNYFSDHLITADSNSIIYCAGWNNHYYKFDGNNWYELTVAIPANNNYPSSIGTDDQHHVWFGSDNGFLAKQEDDLTSVVYTVNYSGLPDDGNYAVSAFYFYGNYDGQGLIGTKDGLFEVEWINHLLSKADSSFNSVLTDKRVNCIEKSADYFYFGIDTVWIGTNEGLFGMDKNYNWVQFTAANSPLPNDTINYILYDYDKLWIATNGGVACYYFNGNWQTFTTSNSPLPSDHVHSIRGSFPGYAFCTTNGVAYYNDPDWKILNTSNSGLIDNDVKEILNDYNNHHYFGTVAHGICDSIYNGAWTYFNSSTGLPSDSIIFISNGYAFGNQIIAGTFGGGILSFENGNYLYNTTNVQGIDFNDATDETILSLGEGAEVWITTDKGLLYKDFGGSAPVIPSQSSDMSAYFSNENLMISYPMIQSGSAQFELFDIRGIRIARVKSFGAEGKNSITIPTSGLSSGIYILRMQSGNQIATVKIMKMN